MKKSNNHPNNKMDNLLTKTLPELKKIATDLQLAGRSKATNKTLLITLILQHYNKVSGAEDLLKPSTKSSSEKVCTNRVSSAYPNRYDRKELEALGKNKGLSSKDLKQPIKELCERLGIPFIQIGEVVEKPKVEKRRPEFVLPPFNPSLDRVKFGTDECIRRSKLPLMPHQIKVIKALQNKHGLIVAHDVGSGKTLTAVAAVMCYLETYPERRAIIITSPSLQGNFKKEIRSYLGEKNVNASIDSRIEFYTYDGFANKTIDCRNTILVVDEAHNLRTEKGVKANAVMTCARIADKVILLTATPVVNSIDEITNLINIVSGQDLTRKELEQVLESEESSKQLFGCRVSVYRPGPEYKGDYPQALSRDRYIKMTPEYYENYMKVEKKIADETIIQRIGKVNAAFLTDVRTASNALEKENSPKVLYILQKIDENPGKKFVIFSNFIDNGINLLTQNLKEDGMPYVEIKGSMSAKQRDAAVASYNSGRVNIMVISRAGGEGLDLKGTNFIFLMEPGWNETQAIQVIGRGVRKGSHAHLPEEERFVEIYRLFLLKPWEMGNRKFYMGLTPDFDDRFPRPSDDEKHSIDFYMRELSRDKQTSIDQFMNQLQEYSVENNTCF